MAKGTKPAAPKVVKPTSISVTQEHVNSASQYAHIPGKVELVALDADGNEIGLPFLISDRQYKKTYSDPTKFALKKNNKPQ